MVEGLECLLRRGNPRVGRKGRGESASSLTTPCAGVVLWVVLGTLSFGAKRL